MAEVYIPEDFGNAVLIWTVTGRAAPITCTIGYAIKPLWVDPIDSATAIYGYAVGAASIGNPASMNTLFTFQGVRVYERRGSSTPLVGAEYIDPEVGTVVLTQEPPSLNNTLIVAKNTAAIGRKYRGRCYGPFTKLAESSVNIYGQLVGTAQTDHQAMWNAFFGLAQVDECDFHLLHGGEPSERPAPTPLTGFTVRGVIGSQRRRRGA